VEQSSLLCPSFCGNSHGLTARRCNPVFLDAQLFLLRRNTLQHAVTRCNTLQNALTCCYTLLLAAKLFLLAGKHTATLQHAATRCNTLFFAAPLLLLPSPGVFGSLSCMHACDASVCECVCVCVHQFVSACVCVCNGCGTGRLAANTAAHVDLIRGCQ